MRNSAGRGFRRSSLAIALGCSLAAGFVQRVQGAEPDPKVSRAWRSKCSSCHGADGKGKTEQGEKMHVPDMTAAEWQKKTTDEKMRQVIVDGVKKDGQELMEPNKDFTPDQVNGLIAKIRSLGK